MIRNFDDKPMKINKTGVIYPVDVELKEEKGQDVLYISTKVKFLDLTMYEYENIDVWRKAILDGFREWSGEYNVFGDQPLVVKVDVRETDKITDCIFVTCVDEEMSEELQDTYGKLKLEKAERIFKQDRSFASAGLPLLGWKTYLPRLICMLPHTLNDFQQARITAKHEFGHVLGLGDLYKDLENGLCGVPGAKYSDISKYYIGNSFFDMVMCNNGPVRNNDIEMVLLAFQTNKFQNYQIVKKSDRVSEALGKGD